LREQGGDDETDITMSGLEEGQQVRTVGEPHLFQHTEFLFEQLLVPCCCFFVLFLRLFLLFLFIFCWFLSLLLLEFFFERVDNQGELRSVSDILEIGIFLEMREIGITMEDGLLQHFQCSLSVFEKAFRTRQVIQKDWMIGLIFNEQLQNGFGTIMVPVLEMSKSNIMKT